MRILVALALPTLMALSAMGQAPFPTVDPVRKAPPGLEGLVWNKWDTDHFSVISLDESAGRALKSEIESTRRDVFLRWGLRESESFFCKLVCVPDAEMLRKLFGLQEPRCEVRKSASGGDDCVAIWIDSGRIDLLPSLVAEADISWAGGPLFLQRGVSVLERSPTSIKSVISAASELPLAAVTNSSKSSEAFKKDLGAFDAASASLCLLIRREYGRIAFGKASENENTPLYLRMRFGSQADFDKTFARYRANLLKDIGSGTTPDEYLGSGPR
jgi:hypothetical protein